MKNFKRGLLAFMLGAWLAGATQAADYGLPADIQSGNILHCFNWKPSDIKAELASIAEAGFGAIQISPVQRGDVNTGSPWHDLYRPYDLAFKSSGYCSEADLQSLCSEAAKYGIKIIVDVVANHVDKTSGYHDTWWDSNGRVRWNGGINYGDRNSITHGQLGDYGDINSESPEVCARAKAYVEKLKSLGVKGIRWDAAKHIGLPSEGCNFWKDVTSVSGMYHYGEILDNPGPNPSIIKEYAQYMSVTDNQYCNYAARDNGGIPGGYGGAWVVDQKLSDTKLVYWAESHDTYANDDWSKDRDQSVIDRAYAAYACRAGATCLYLSRPNTKGFSNIKIAKGSLNFKNKQVAEVNKFRNIMAGKADWFESNGNACSITRKDGGAVIVMKGSGNVSITNGGGYCPAGTYTDRVNGGKFTVTSSTISGSVGPSGVAVIYNDGIQPNPNPDPDPDPNPNPNPGSVTISGDYNLAYSGTKENVHYWGATASTWPGVKMESATGSDGKTYKVAKVPAGTTGLVFNTNGDSNKTGDLTYDGSHVMDDNGSTNTSVTFGSSPTPPTPPIPGDGVYVYVDGWDNVHCYIYKDGSAGEDKAWPGTAMTKDSSTGYWQYKVPDSYSSGSLVIINTNGGSNRYPADMEPGMPLNGKSMIFRTSGNKWEEYSNGGGGGDDPVKPVVTANPASGTSFTDNLSVTLSVSPAATIYYTTNGSTPSASSTKYTSAIKLTESTTIKTYAVTSEGASNIQSFSYTKGAYVEPTPGTNLITDYYKVNPNGQCGTNRTVNMKFTKTGDNKICGADNAMSNWTDADLIAQGVGRDIASAIRGKHEYPCIDSYAIYASYDAQNLYLGVQYVYSTWDQWGDGILTNGAAKPWNMDGRLMIAFDLDPNKSFSGVLANGNTIWDSDGKYNTFDNGTDCIWLGSTKSTVGQPALFFPDANGNASYDGACCVSLDAPFYGCYDGLLPAIKNIWAPADFEYDPEILKGNAGFTDIRGKAPDDQHTFYEFKFPLSKLGISESHIKNVGIGVMVIDTYGQGAIGCTPYDPTVFDNAKKAYSKDESSSAEKEDMDIFTYSHARIGKARTSGIINVADQIEAADAEPEYYTLQGMRVSQPSNGIYIVRRGNKVTKQLFK